MLGDPVAVQIVDAERNRAADRAADLLVEGAMLYFLDIEIDTQPECLRLLLRVQILLST
jgi:hypothetical protein